MSRNQPENLVKIFLFILGAILILILFIFILFNIIIPNFNNVQPSREYGSKSLPRDSVINTTASSKSEINSIQKDEKLVSNLQQAEVDKSSSYSVSSIQATFSSSSSSYLVKNDRGNYQDQIGAYDPIQ
jgi:hypothetical protein